MGVKLLNAWSCAGGSLAMGNTVAHRGLVWKMPAGTNPVLPKLCSTPDTLPPVLPCSCPS